MLIYGNFINFNTFRWNVTKLLKQLPVYKMLPPVGYFWGFHLNTERAQKSFLSASESQTWPVGSVDLLKAELVSTQLANASLPPAAPLFSSPRTFLGLQLTVQHTHTLLDSSMQTKLPRRVVLLYTSQFVFIHSFIHMHLYYCIYGQCIKLLPI